MGRAQEGSASGAAPRDAGAALAGFEQALASNSGEDAFEVAIRLLAAKLLDELRGRERGGAPRFSDRGTAAAVHRRVAGLVREALRRWPELAGDGARAPAREAALALTPEQLVRCLRPLLGWRILGSDLAHLDATLERLVAPAAKGSLGQYFTPRDVVRLCVGALHPRPEDTVIDPACGSGGFLHEAVRQGARAGGRAPRCLGIDLGTRSLKVAHLVAHAVGDGAITVTRGNSLDGRGCQERSPAGWQPFLAPAAPPSSGDAPWGPWHRLRCSLLLTNPPFAGAIDDAAVLARYDSQRARRAARKGAVGREHLFLERAVQLLAPGGRLAIVVPQGVLANASAAYLRQWLLGRCRVLAVVGLHPHAFLPHTAVKTALLFLEKPLAPPAAGADYPVLFRVSRAPGKDGRGRSMGTSDYDAITAELRAHFVAEGRAWAGPVAGAPRPAPASEPAGELVRLREVVAHDRLDAEYWEHAVRQLHREVQGRTAARLGDVVARSVARYRRRDPGVIGYLDISSVDPRTGVARPVSVDGASAPSRAAYLVEEGDVLVSTVRPERNVVALVRGRAPAPVVASNGFCVLRPRALPPEVLFAYCKTAAFRRLLARRATASMYPAVTDRDVLDLPFVAPPAEVQAAVVRRVRAGLDLLDDARRLIAEGIALMERHLDEPQATAGRSCGRGDWSGTARCRPRGTPCGARPSAPRPRGGSGPGGRRPGGRRRGRS